MPHDDTPNEPKPSLFPPTRWTLVLDAQDDDPSALAALCKTYWFPLYCFARRLRPHTEEAEDLTQGFFHHLLSKNHLTNIKSGRGKLRSFLMSSLQNYANDEFRKSMRLKRGGNKEHVSFEVADAEARAEAVLDDTEGPEVAFDRAWARQIMKLALQKVADDYTTAGKENLFTHLRPQLESEISQTPYSKIADKLEMSEGSIRLAAFKIRKRYKNALHEAIADTVTGETEVAEEFEYLRTVFG